MTDIAVCIATYRRPEGLRCLLKSLEQQRGVNGRYIVIVIDNDAHGTARSVIDAYSGADLDVIYAIEPDPGIPAARNRSIEIARDRDVDAVAFIDDDEVATPQWLKVFSERLELSGADAVSGPVHPVFPEGAPPWAGPSGLFNRPEYEAGASLAYASTANSMVRLSSIRHLDQPFDQRFRFTGGSDSHLYHSLYNRGARIVWEPDALVYEHVPLDRISLSWIAARSYRQGITLARCDRMIHGDIGIAARRAVRGAAQVPLGLAQGLGGAILRTPRWRRGVVHIARGVGSIVGLFGAEYAEYQRR